MKIIAIGRNYADHIAELHNEVPEEPVIFFKPDTAILRNNEPFYYPAFTTDVHYEAELILRVCREGKEIDKKFAHKYYDAIGLGIDFTARDLQAKAKAKGLPWALAKGFNGSAPISEMLPLTQFTDLQQIRFRLDVNGQTRQNGDSAMMLHSFDDIIAYISRFVTLKTGDIIFTGTPQGVGPIRIGDRLEGYVEDKKLLDFEIK